MSSSVLLSALVAGLFSSNIVASNGVGIELGTNNLSSVKNALTYSLIIFASALFASITLYIANLALISLDVVEYFAFVAMLAISVFVQIAEYLTKKLLPLFFTQTKYFVPALVSILFIMVIGAFSQAINFLHLLVIIISEGLGIMLVLCLVAGIRASHRTLTTKPVLKGNLLSLIILFFTMLAFTAL